MQDTDAGPAWPEPPSLNFSDLALQPLTAALLDLDTEAYRAAPDAIREHSGGRWRAAETFTAEENAPLVAQHEAEHRGREAFAYSLLDADAERAVGCAYLRTLAAYQRRSSVRLAEGPAGGAILTFWLVDDAAVRPSHEDVLKALIAWAARWGVAPVVLRCLPGEVATVAGAEALGLRRAAVVGETPYAWFEIVQPLAVNTARIGALSTSVDPR